MNIDRMEFIAWMERIMDRFDILNARVTKFSHRAALRTYYMIMLFEAKRFFVLREIFAKLMLFHQIAMHQKFQRVVNRGATHSITLIFHVDVQGFCVEMIIAPVDFFEDGVAFGRFSTTGLFEVNREYIADFSDYIGSFLIGRHGDFDFTAKVIFFLEASSFEIGFLIKKRWRYYGKTDGADSADWYGFFCFNALLLSLKSKKSV